jgi:AraC-like DNA-binding protein
MRTEAVSVCTPSLSAFYLPPLCEPPEIPTARSTQVLIANEAPLVSIASPRRLPPLLKSYADCVVLALDRDAIGNGAQEIGIQEACDPYLYGLGHALRCGFRHGILPPPRYLEELAPSIAEHLKLHYPVRLRKRERQGLSPARLARALLLIDERLTGSLSVEELADCVHLSPFHFTRMFRRSTGYSPHAYITMRRLAKSKELVATTSRPMGEIAKVVGYKNQAHFTRVFHANVGMTPRRYRATNAPNVRHE